MIGKKNKPNFEAPDRLNRLVEGTKIIGEIVSDSSMRIDGEVQGNINCAGKVLIGENSIIKGNLNCTEADIEGKVEGDLKIESLLVLREKANVNGNISTPKIEIHQGAIFVGNCSMSGNTSKSNSGSKKQEDLVY